MSRYNLSLWPIRRLAGHYPRQYWLLMCGVLIEITGYSMVWPFLTIYLRSRMDVPLATVALLFTMNSAAGLVSTTVTGPVLDHFGRKRAMIVGLSAMSTILMAMSAVNALPAWFTLMALQGAFSPLYRVGVDAMIADLIEPEWRPNAYALMRTSFNLGVALGPSIGGFIAAVSYSRAFYVAAGSTAVVALLILLLAAETAPHHAAAPARKWEGLGPVLHDRPFLAFCGISTLALTPSTLLMLLLPVYAKENFHVPENQYGFIMATNAVLVVLFQYTVTQFSKRHPAFRMLTLGALLHALGAGSVALGRGFSTFLVSMVILTTGEMFLIPTATVFAANLAPVDMRGRYMALYGLAWSVSAGIGPVIGGLLHDRVAPVAIWYGGLALGLAAVLGYVLLRRKLRTPTLSLVAREDSL